MIGYALVAFGIILADIISKQWALRTCVDTVVFNQFFACHLTINRGVTWSMFHSESPFYFGLVTIVIACVIVLLVWYTYHQWLEYRPIWGETCVLAGALANMIDRLWHSGVIDFIVIGYKSFVWPIFNVADMAIVFGVGVMLLGMLRK